jgi:hypothetical protein
MTLRDSYDGAFDPDLSLADFSRQALADLGREYLLAGHLIDRVGIPLVLERFGDDDQAQFAIDEWMGASPIYSERMQRALRFEGDDVATVFKNLQLDIGAPPQFMDFQFRLDRPDYGEFWLCHCGALLDVEPFGEEQVRLMCHDIEDPTFDATAAATNPRMKVRPIHRPPRVPQDRYPHCHWRVFVDEVGAKYEQHPHLEIVRASKLAAIDIELPESDAEPGGWNDYSGPFDPGFQLEDLSHRALLAVAQEAAVQAHLLVRAYLLAVSERWGAAAARELGTRQWIGSAALNAQRLRATLGIEGDGIDAVAKTFQFHPHFFPRTYVAMRVEITGTDSARVEIADCPAFAETDDYSWFAQLDTKSYTAIDAIAGAVNPRARCRPATRSGAASRAWDVTIDADAEPREEPAELRLARLSRGADFQLMRRRPLRGE